MESGVANGVSTFFILNALSKNGNGSLVSIDITDDVATFLTDEEKKRWRLKVIDIRHNPRKQFQKIMDEAASLSIYIHDGDHSYTWQTMEYYAALKKLKAGGLLFSDDIDSSYAFIDVCGNKGKYTDISLKGILVGQSKIFGYARKT